MSVCGNMKRSRARNDLLEIFHSKKVENQYAHTKKCDDDIFHFDMCDICHISISNQRLSNANNSFDIDTCHKKDCIDKANKLLE